MLAPVEERGLAAHQAGGGVVGVLAVIGNALLDDGVHLAQPGFVAGGLVDFPGRRGPDNTVRRARVGPARAGVLNDAAAGTHLAHQAVHGHFGLQAGLGQNDAVAHIAGPDAGPLLAGAEGAVRLHGAAGFFQGQVVEGIGQRVVGAVLREIIGVDGLFPTRGGGFGGGGLVQRQQHFVDAVAVGVGHFQLGLVGQVIEIPAQRGRAPGNVHVLEILLVQLVALERSVEPLLPERRQHRAHIEPDANRRVGGQVRIGRRGRGIHIPLPKHDGGRFDGPAARPGHGHEQVVEARRHLIVLAVDAELELHARALAVVHRTLVVGYQLGGGEGAGLVLALHHTVGVERVGLRLPDGLRHVGDHGGGVGGGLGGLAGTQQAEGEQECSGKGAGVHREQGLAEVARKCKLRRLRARGWAAETHAAGSRQSLRRAFAAGIPATAQFCLFSSVI